MFKTKIKTTYSFAKLNRSIDKILRESVDNLGKVGESIMKQRIDSGLKPPLSPFTLKMRKKGIGWGGKKVGAPISDLPLKQTGALYRSLTYIKKDQTIKMLAYGKDHHDGNLGVAARPFMDLEGETTFETTGRSVAMSPLIRKLKKAFKK